MTLFTGGGYSAHRVLQRGCGVDAAHHYGPAARIGRANARDGATEGNGPWQSRARFILARSGHTTVPRDPRIAGIESGRVHQLRGPRCRLLPPSVLRAAAEGRAPVPLCILTHRRVSWRAEDASSPVRNAGSFLLRVPGRAIRPKSESTVSGPASACRASFVGLRRVVRHAFHVACASLAKPRKLCAEGCAA